MELQMIVKEIWKAGKIEKVVCMHMYVLVYMLHNFSYFTVGWLMQPSPLEY